MLKINKMSKNKSKNNRVNRQNITTTHKLATEYKPLIFVNLQKSIVLVPLKVKTLTIII